MLKRRKGWKIYWKNLGWIGRMFRMGTAGTMFIGAFLMRKNILLAILMGLVGAEQMFEGVMKWNPQRALFKMPAKGALKKHPEAA